MCREGELEFDFTRAVGWTKPDAPRSPVPETMKKVDFIIEEAGRFILLEVKDPSASQVTEPDRDRFIRELNGKQLVNQELVPKCRDTYTYLHLMRQDNKPLVYVVLVSLYDHKPKKELFLALTDKLKNRLHKEGAKKWQRPYVSDCVVLNVPMWNQRFRYYPVTRIIGRVGNR